LELLEKVTYRRLVNTECSDSACHMIGIGIVTSTF
jgi:hypothetical protein